MDLISRQDAIDALDRIFDRCEEIEAHLPEGDPDRTGYRMLPDYMTVWKYLRQLPSAQPEITEDDVKEFCRKKCLIVVTSDFYDEMIRRWASAQPEIIHCEDCRWWKESGDGLIGLCLHPKDAYDCQTSVVISRRRWYPGDYSCGSAERRQDG